MTTCSGAVRWPNSTSASRSFPLICSGVNRVPGIRYVPFLKAPADYILT